MLTEILKQRYDTWYIFLCAVAKRKSLFDDKATEIDELTYIVKQVRKNCCIVSNIPITKLIVT